MCPLGSRFRSAPPRTRPQGRINEKTVKGVFRFELGPAGSLSKLNTSRRMLARLAKVSLRNLSAPSLRCTIFEVQSVCRPKLTTVCSHKTSCGIVHMVRIRSLHACLKCLEVDLPDSRGQGSHPSKVATPDVLSWLTQKQQTEQAQVSISSVT